MYTEGAVKEQAHLVNCAYQVTRNNNRKIIYKEKKVSTQSNIHTQKTV